MCHCISLHAFDIPFHCIAWHYISFSRSSTLVFKIFNPDSGFKTFLSKSILKPGLLISILSFANPQDLIFWNVFLRKQYRFVLNSIFNWFQFSDETHLGGVASRFLHLSKISKNFRVLVGSELYLFIFLKHFQNSMLILNQLRSYLLSKSSVLDKILES